MCGRRPVTWPPRVSTEQLAPRLRISLDAARDANRLKSQDDPHPDAGTAAAAAGTHGRGAGPRPPADPGSGAPRKGYS
eukprot:1753308-Prymnesium_polylepis.1